MKKFLYLMAAAVCATACIYPYDPELDEAPEGVLSVDATICIGGTSTVRLGTLISMWDSGFDRREDLSDARVWVEDDAGVEYPGTSKATGFPGYDIFIWNPLFTIPTENAPLDRRYRLRIEALGETYGSDWNEPLSPPVIRNIGFSANDEVVTVDVSMDGGENGTGYALLSYEETWEFNADYIPGLYQVNYDEASGLVSVVQGLPDLSHYRCWRTTTDNRTTPIDYTGRTESGITGFPLFVFPRRDKRNQIRYCISVTASSISKDTYRFLHNLDENTNGGDNLFTPNPGEIAGNIRCESNPERTALGYAVFSRAARKRAFLDSRYYLPSPKISLQYPLVENYYNFWKSGFLPLEEHLGEYDPSKEGPYGWGARNCYDCTAAGGTLEKPDYWNETE